MQELLQQANDREDAEDAHDAQESADESASSGGGLSLPGGGNAMLGMTREPSTMEMEATDPFNIETGDVIVGAGAFEFDAMHPPSIGSCCLFQFHPQSFEESLPRSARKLNVLHLAGLV
jgi:hypothetical protein